MDWGCGSACVNFAVVDSETGNVYSPEFPLYALHYDTTEKEEAIIKLYPNQFRLNSRLLVALGSVKGKGEGIFFYKWEKSRFNLIRSVDDDK